MSNPEAQKMVEEITKHLTDEGKIIEAGWMALKVTCIPPDSPKDQLEEMRNAFFAGAQHLFGSIMTILSDGEDATEEDIKRLGLINSELQAFIVEYSVKHKNGASA